MRLGRHLLDSVLQHGRNVLCWSFLVSLLVQLGHRLRLQYHWIFAIIRRGLLLQNEPGHRDQKWLFRHILE